MESLLMFFQIYPYSNGVISDDDIHQVEENLLGTAFFFLNNLPFHDHHHPIENNPEHPDYIPLLAATYFRPLQQILSSDLNTCGFVKAIYVNFGPKGYYKLNPLIPFPPTIQAFELALRLLFSSRVRLLDPLFNSEPWRKFNDLPSLISDLPDEDDSLIIGCLHGDVTQGLPAIPMEYESYINHAPESKAFVFVVGQIVGQEIEQHIDDFVKVDEQELYPHDCLEIIISAMENKWGGH